MTTVVPPQTAYVTHVLPSRRQEGEFTPVSFLTRLEGVEGFYVGFSFILQEHGFPKPPRSLSDLERLLALGYRTVQGDERITVDQAVYESRDNLFSIAACDRHLEDQSQRRIIVSRIIDN